MIAIARGDSQHVTPQILNELKRLFQNDVQTDVSLEHLTTFRCSAKASAIVLPPDLGALIRLIEFLSASGLRFGSDWRVIGRGSNVLVRDGGFPGVLVDLSKGFSAITLVTEDNEQVHVRSEGGVPNGTFLQWLRQRNLAGFGFSFGIPGTTGGGIRMNAGTPLGSFSQVLTEVEGVKSFGETMKFEVSEGDFMYRDFPKGSDLVITAGTFRFARADLNRVQNEIEAAKKRRANQPLDQPNIGSVFKNPTNDFAGRLIEAAGLKGLRSGNAEISARHANFIVNLGAAKTADALALIDRAQDTVREKFSVTLEPEVHIFGVDA